MRTPLESLLLVYVLLISVLFFNGCKSKETQSLAKTPIQNELEISVPSFEQLEIVGSETITISKKSDAVLSNLEKMDENIIPVQSSNELVFKGGETPVPNVKNANGFSILISSSRLEVGEPITFYVNTTSPLTWQLGDGTTNTGKKISHIFQKPGQYKIEAFNADKTQRNRIEILVLCSTEYVLNKLNLIQKAAYSNDEKSLLRNIDEFKKLFKSSNLVIELTNNNQGKGIRKFNDVDAFMDYILIRTEQNKEKGYLDQAVINGVKQLETSSESSLLSKITLYE
ncbi:MAG: hypothetical protein RLZZ417_2059 [Bacteroidota bacterium]|jgi:hypothetical protein